MKPKYVYFLLQAELKCDSHVSNLLTVVTLGLTSTITYNDMKVWKKFYFKEHPHFFCFLLFQIITTFSVVDNMKEQFYAQQAKVSRYDEGSFYYILSLLLSF